MQKTIAGIALAFSLAIASFAGGVYAQRIAFERNEIQNAPYCPSEDSCRVDYRDGKWFIIEQTP
jgi:hypothetical protein